MRSDFGIPTLEVRSIEMLETLSHPLRTRILLVLDERPLGVQELARELGIDIGGQLQFHLAKLAHLVEMTPDGLYMLTSNGKVAIENQIRAMTKTEARGFGGLRRTSIRKQGASRRIHPIALVGATSVAKVFLGISVIMMALKLFTLLGKTIILSRVDLVDVIAIAGAGATLAFEGRDLFKAMLHQLRTLLPLAVAIGLIVAYFFYTLVFFAPSF